MNIVMACGAGIGFPPNGTAPSARVMAYAVGLNSIGEKVRVLCLGTSEDPRIGVVNTESRGVVEGIEFEYTCGTPVRGDSFLRRRWYTIKGLFVAALRLISLRARDKVDVLILYPDTLGTALWFWLLARFCGAYYLLEKSEHPLVNFQGGYILRLYGFIYSHTVYKLFDGVIVISEFLQSYMARLLRRNAQVIKIPILVNVDQFSSQIPSNGEKYIAYCGTLNQQKDGVLSLMRAYMDVRRTFPAVKLYLIGDAHRESQIPHFQNYAERLGILDSVVFTGIVGRKRLPEYLAKATILALARPSSLQANAGFPTKVGEYLATGKPVVVTITGELKNYLQDGVNAFLCPPDDEKAFSDRLYYVLSNPDTALRVGACGQELARQFFDPRKNAMRLRDFIQQLKYKL